MKRTPDQIKSLFTQMGTEAVAEALSNRTWRTNTYNKLAVQWLIEQREKPEEKAPVNVPVDEEVSDKDVSAASAEPLKNPKPLKKPKNNTPRK